MNHVNDSVKPSYSSLRQPLVETRTLCSWYSLIIPRRLGINMQFYLSDIHFPRYKTDSLEAVIRRGSSEFVPEIETDGAEGNNVAESLVVFASLSSDEVLKKSLAPYRVLGLVLSTACQLLLVVQLLRAGGSSDEFTFDKLGGVWAFLFVTNWVFILSMRRWWADGFAFVNACLIAGILLALYTGIISGSELEVTVHVVTLAASFGLLCISNHFKDSLMPRTFRVTQVER